MTPQEWWLIYEVKKPKDPRASYAGTLTEEDCAELYELSMEST